MEKTRAEEYLRDIHAIMERSVKHSTFSGLSGLVAGLAAVTGAILSTWIAKQRPFLAPPSAYERFDNLFLLVWLGVFVVAVVADIIFTKRKAAKIGKRFFDRPMRRVLLVFLPGLVTGAIVTVYLYLLNLVPLVPAFWMLFYGLALISASTISIRELWWLGMGFLAGGLLTLFPLADHAMLMMGLSFGGLHLVYGTYMWSRYGG